MTVPKANRLIHEKSPYLQQHAHNPVDWYPWSAEALEKASKENKPVFLSVGYSTCHWCHVMEEESFSSGEIAGLLNRYFVPVKVDREERPDLDHVYMEAVMAMTGHGGWPLNVFLTPQLEPFYGGTYFPPDDRFGRPGFKTVLLSISRQWEEKREGIEKAGRQLVEAIRQHATELGAETRVLDEKIFEKAFGELAGRFDEVYGGFGEAPKFPGGHTLSFLMAHAFRSGNGHALEMVERTLEGMARGGIHDHLGGGFHRYSTDERWHVPHFEKMLYDQALLVRPYLEAFLWTGKKRYADVARNLLAYTADRLRGEHGGFYSAEDADSLEAGSGGGKKEGAYYVWTAEEIKKELDPREFEIFSAFYGIAAGGNVRQDPFGELENKNVLYETGSQADLAVTFGLPPAELTRLLERCRAKLEPVRRIRPRPHLDDKVLTDWNALMISGYALAAKALQEPEYGHIAGAACDFILKHLRAPSGRLLHRWRDGEAAIPAFLDDYAFLINALIEVYEVSFELHFLEEAVRLAGEMLDLFEDKGRGGFYLSGAEAERTLTNPKPVYDGAVPSGNSAAIVALARLGRLTASKRFEEAARRALDAFSYQIAEHPSLYPYALTGLGFLTGPSMELVIAARRSDEEGAGLIQAVQTRYLPYKVMALNPQDEQEAGRLKKTIPYAGGHKTIDGRAAVYVCRNYACQAPVTDVHELERTLTAP